MASLDCKICFEKFDRIKHKPYILLTCGHTFCIVCIDKFREKKCPKCNGEIQDKKLNHQLFDMLEMKNEEKLRNELQRAIAKTEMLKNKLNEIYQNKLKENTDKFKELNEQINAKTEANISLIHTEQRTLLDQVKTLINKTDDELDVVHFFQMNSKSKITPDFIGKLKVNQPGRAIKETNEIIESDEEFDELNFHSFQEPKKEFQSNTELLTYHMSEACKNLHSLKWKRAIEHLDEVIKVDPKFSASPDVTVYSLNNPYGKKAYALGHLLRYEEALPYYDLSHKDYPNQYVTYFHQGEALRELFRYKESLDSFQKCITLNTFCPKAYLEAARVHAQAKNFKACLDNFKIVNKLDPNNYEYGHFKALALLGLSRVDECHTYLDAALKYNPYDFQLLIAKSHAYRLKGRSDLARKWYEKAIQINPDMMENMHII